MCQSRLGCPTQKKTWHTCMLLWYAMISLISSWSQFYGWAHIWDDHSLVFSHLYWAVLYHLAFCLVSFCPHLVLILINDTPPGESNKSKRSCSANYSHGLRGTLPLCVNKSRHYGLRFHGFVEGCGDLPLRRVWVHHLAHYVTISRYGFICLQKPYFTPVCLCKSLDHKWKQRFIINHISVSSHADHSRRMVMGTWATAIWITIICPFVNTSTVLLFLRVFWKGLFVQK